MAHLVLWMGPAVWLGDIMKFGSLRIHVERHEGVTVLALEGVVDSRNIRAFKKLLCPICPVYRKGGDCTIVDLSGLSYINSRGVELLSRYYRRNRVDRGRVAICGAKEGLLKNMRAMGFGNTIKMYPTRYHALAVFQQELVPAAA